MTDKTARTTTMTWGFALSVVFVGIAKVITVITNATRAYIGFKDAVVASNRAMMTLRLSPILLVLAGLAAVTAHLIQQHRDHAKAVRDLEQSYKDAASAIEAMKLAGADPRDITAQTNLEKSFADTTKAIQERKAALTELLLEQEQLRQQMDPNLAGGPAVDPIVKFIESLQKEIDELDVSEGKLAEGHRKMIDILSMQNVNIPQVVGIFTRLNEELAKTGDIDAWNAGIQEVEATIGSFVDEEKAAGKATGDLGDEMEELGEKFTTVSEFFSGGIEPTEAFRESIAGLINDVRELAGVTIGTDDPLGMIKMLTGMKSANVFDLLSDLTTMRKTDLVHFDKSTREAFELADQLERVRAKLVQVDEAIQNNSDDIGMWQGRIDLVNDTLGENTDTMGEWERQLHDGEITQDEFNEAVASGEAHTAMADAKKLLDEGRISRKQYNDIVEAGTFLLDRSTGALQDERAEQALLLVDLAEQVKRQDELNANMEKLPAASRERIAALQSEAGQMTIFTMVLLRLLEAMNMIPEGAAIKFGLDIAAVDPAMGELLEDIGLLQDASPITVDVAVGGAKDGRNTMQAVAAINNELKSIEQHKLDLKTQFREGTITSEKYLENLNQLNVAQKELTQRRNIIAMAIDTGNTMTEVDQISGLITKIRQSKDGIFTIDVDDKEAVTKIREILDLKVDDKHFRFVIDGIGSDESLDHELARRIRKAGAAAGLTFEGDDFVTRWRLKITDEDTSPEERLSEIAFLIKSVTGDMSAISVGIDTKSAETAIMAITGFIDQSLLTHDFMAFLDVNNDGALDNIELTILAAQGFETTYQAYLRAEAYEALSTFEEVDGVKTEVLEDGTVKITADSQAALEEFDRLNNEELEGAVFPIEVELKMGSDVDATGIPELGGLEEGAETDISVTVGMDTSSAETEMQTFLDTDVATFVTNLGTKGTEAGTEFDTGLNTGVSTAASNVVGQLDGIVSSMDRSGETWNIGFNTGWNLGDGIRAGIEATIGAIQAAAAAAVSAAAGAAAVKAESNSPSKLFARLGRDLMLGMAMGVEENERSLTTAISDSLGGAFKGALPVGGWQAAGMAAGAPLSPAMVASAGAGNIYNVNMDVTVPAANFKEWIGTVEFVQQIKTGFGVTLAGSRSR